MRVRATSLNQQEENKVKTQIIDFEVSVEFRDDEVSADDICQKIASAPDARSAMDVLCEWMSEITFHGGQIDNVEYDAMSDVFDE